MAKSSAGNHGVLKDGLFYSILFADVCMNYSAIFEHNVVVNFCVGKTNVWTYDRAWAYARMLVDHQWAANLGRLINRRPLCNYDRFTGCVPTEFMWDKVVPRQGVILVFGEEVGSNRFGHSNCDFAVS
jgi:hypothetical protein